MVKCLKCHNESIYFLPVHITPPDSFNIEVKMWCLGCVYREGNREHYKQNPIPSISLD